MWFLLLACAGGKPDESGGDDSGSTADSSPDSAPDSSADSSPDSATDSSPDCVEEVCNGLDDDCDGEIDEDAVDATTAWTDADGDGYGDPDAPVTACDSTGTSTDASDCDDTDAETYPGAPDVCGDGEWHDCDLACPPEWGVNLGDEGAVLRGTLQFGYAGNSLAGVGDLDGDGRGELLVGAHNETLSASNSGAAYLVAGASIAGDQDLPDVGWQWAGEGAFSGAGADVAGGVDLDGDTLPEVVVVAAHNPSDTGEAGIAYVFSGIGPAVGAGSVTDAVTTLTCEESEWWARAAVGGDVDGDGLGDTILGCAGDQAAFVFVAPTGALGSADAYTSFTSSDADYWLGGAVSAAGDTDGDGVGDWLVGGYDLDTSIGKAWLVSGSMTGDATLEDVGATLEGETLGDYAGSTVAGLGDLDGDGFDEVGVGAPGSSRPGRDAGVAYVLYGSTSATSTSSSLASADLVVEGAPADLVGSAFASTDVDGNGTLDLLIGAVGSAEVLLFLGPVPSGVVSAGSADLTLVGGASFDGTGAALAALGDVDGDGIDDVAVGSYGHDGDERGEGAVYVLFGGGM